VRHACERQGCRTVVAGLLALLALACTPANAEPLLADWAVLVVAADEKASNGAVTEGFDNARRALSAALIAKGVKPANLRQLSVDPARDKTADRPLRATPETLDQALGEVAGRARGGCLLYFTSHGDRRGIALGSDVYAPAQMDRLADAHCAGRPTVVVVSACYSGVFLPALDGPERLILSAARPDRASFGCGQNDHMPYFDACVLEALPAAPGFAALAVDARRCVAAMEKAARLRPASEPQVAVGAEMRALLPLLQFAG
jgi:hypothetical protein